MSVFRVQRRVEFCDTDMAGIVHFANFFRYMEFAEVAFLRSLGLNVKMEADGRKIGFPRVSATCDYIRPARFEDVLDISLRVDRLGEKSVTYAIDFQRGPDLIARGKVTSVCCLVHEENRLEAIPISAVYRGPVEAFAKSG
ncbi:MAG: thioesterase family protein [Gemmataceae bacterium]